MAGRARLITRGSMLWGQRINDYQWNPTAGLARASDEAPAKAKRRKGVTHARSSAATGVVLVPCPKCGVMVSVKKKNRHLRRVHSADFGTR